MNPSESRRGRMRHFAEECPSFKSRGTAALLQEIKSTRRIMEFELHAGRSIAGRGHCQSIPGF